MPGFVHLHVHSSYSLLEGALTIARLCELAKADRQPALALTDTDNMFGALEFSDKMAAAGIQPIVGCTLAVDFADQDALPRTGSPQQLEQMRKWVSRPAGSTGIGPGDALFGSFVGLFVRQIGTADKTLRFRTQPITP